MKRQIPFNLGRTLAMWILGFLASLGTLNDAQAVPPPHFYLYYNMSDPVASPQLSAFFRSWDDLGLQYGNLYTQFTSRMSSFSFKITEEANQAQESYVKAKPQLQQLQSPRSPYREARLRFSNQIAAHQNFQEQLRALQNHNQQSPDGGQPSPAGRHLDQDLKDAIEWSQIRTSLIQPFNEDQAFLQSFIRGVLDSGQQALNEQRLEDAENLKRMGDHLNEELYRMYPGSVRGVDELQQVTLPESYYQKRLNGIPLRSNPTSIQGKELRGHFNTFLASREVIQDKCRLAAGSIDCAGVNQILSQTELNLLLSDRLLHQGFHQEATNLLETVTPYLTGLRGFSGGLLKGSIEIGAGLAAIAFLPAELTFTASAAVLGYATYQAYSFFADHSGEVTQILKEKWQDFIGSSPERKGAFLGEVTATIGGLFLGGPISAEIKGALEVGTELLLFRTATSEMALAGRTEGTISGALCDALVDLSKTNPRVASELAQSRMGRSAVPVATPEVTIGASDFASLTEAQQLERLAQAPLGDWEGPVWRAVPQTVVKSDGSVVTNTESTVFDWHEGIKKAGGRYSKVGTEALYTSVGEDVVAWETVMEELGYRADDPLVLTSKNFKFERVLDLTDAATLKILGINKAELVQPLQFNPSAYKITHRIGELAMRLKIDALIVESAANSTGKNFVIFRK